VAGGTGGIFDFTSAQLGAGQLASQTPAFIDATGRPGFGGLYIENDE